MDIVTVGSKLFTVNCLQGPKDYRFGSPVSGIDKEERQSLAYSNGQYWESVYTCWAMTIYKVVRT